MSQTGTPTEFLKLGITEPDDTLNVLVDLNGQWQKIDTGVKNVDTKANTNATSISALNTAVQDNTENITNILETNVNQQTSIDTLQAKVATLEEDDTSYGSRITAVEAGVQENSELINDLEVDLSGVKTSVGTVPEGSNLQGEVNGLDTRVTALENSGSVAAVEARVTTLETEVGTVPAGETVQGQITTLNGQVNSGNIPFRFSVDGGGNYGYLKADDSFVPFSVGGDSHLHELDTTMFTLNHELNSYMEYPWYSFIVPYNGIADSSSPNHNKIHDFIHDVDYTVPFNVTNTQIIGIIGSIAYKTVSGSSSPSNLYLINNNNFTQINETLVGAIYDVSTNYTHYLTRNNNACTYKIVDVDGNTVGLPVSFTLHGTSSSPMYFTKSELWYDYSGTHYMIAFNTETGTSTESRPTTAIVRHSTTYFSTGYKFFCTYGLKYDNTTTVETVPNNVAFFTVCPNGSFINKVQSKYYYYL